MDQNCSALRVLLFFSFFYSQNGFLMGTGLVAWSDWEEEQKNIVSKMCKKCQTDGESIYEAARETMWDLLPSFFGLSEWDELENN
jgi:hypothetical protein